MNLDGKSIDFLFHYGDGMISAGGMLLLFYTYGADVTQEVSEDLTPPPQYLKFQTIDLLLVGSNFICFLGGEHSCGIKVI